VVSTSCHVVTGWVVFSLRLEVQQRDKNKPYRNREAEYPLGKKRKTQVITAVAKPTEAHE
jgi:hypothetical protein